MKPMIANRTLGEQDVANEIKGVEHALRGLSGGPGSAVLIVEPSPDHQARVARLLAVRGHRAIGTTSVDGAMAFMRAFPVDLVLLAEEIATVDRQLLYLRFAERSTKGRCSAFRQRLVGAHIDTVRDRSNCELKILHAPFTGDDR